MRYLSCDASIRLRFVVAAFWLLLMMVLLPAVSPASPTTGTAWKISLVAQPTNFPVSGGSEAGRYAIVLTNVGGRPSSGTVTVTDTVPEGMTILGGEGAPGFGWSCGPGGGRTLTCSYTGFIVPVVESFEETVTLNIGVAVGSGVSGDVLTDTVVASGGSAPVASATVSTAVGATSPAFGFLDASSQLTDASGASDTQAGDRPAGMTMAFDFPERNVGGKLNKPVALPRAMRIGLPAGLTGSILATPQCRVVEVFANSCPASRRVGTLFANLAEREQLLFNVYGIPIYNVVPEHGYPAEFGAFVPAVGKPAFFYVTARTGSDYGLDVAVPDIPSAGEVTNVVASFFGDPGTMDGIGRSPAALLTNRSNCASGAAATTLTADTWEEPLSWVSAEAAMPGVIGCSVLQFQPTLSLVPEGGVAETGAPSGFAAELQVPQSQSAVEGLATPDVKDATATLPAGVSLNPSAANGLVACPAEGPEGINITGPESTEAPPNEGVEERRSAPGHCPSASQVGTVEATTPALPEPLHGHVYVAAPGCGGAGQAPCEERDVLDGNLFGLYIELEGSGVIIKLHGTASANPATGQLKASFRELPQQPVSNIKLTLKGGSRAPLASPRSCGEALTTSIITPWSSPDTPDTTPSSAFNVTGCEGDPFAPSFLAGTTNTSAGVYTNFSATFGRSDPMQNLGTIQVQTPPGLLGSLSHVTLCEEPRAALGACSPDSRIGTATTGAGAGGQPFWVSGPVYVTGPYKGAPFGLSVAIPAVAGPFNLGTVVVRSALNVDPVTSALTITSDPLPQILDGVPLRIQTVNVTVDRSQFMFNPTNCKGQQVTAKIASIEGSVAQVSSPFAAGGCKNLPFNPGFKVTVRAPGSKKKGTSLDVKISSAPGQANIHSVSVKLPRQLPSRLTTIQQACPEATFAANPATCPVGSLIGIAKGITPVLPVPIVGPAYLVSHGGAAFPNLELVLQGEGVRIDLTGSINIARGITSSTFASVPDAPISNFDLRLPEGKYSALTPNGDLCAKPLNMPTTIVGQNGSRLTRTTKIAVAGCPKGAGKNKAAARRSRQHGKASRLPMTKRSGR